MDTGFAIFLIVVLLLSVGTSILQSALYSRAAQRLAAAYAGKKDFYLVSGRGKGRLRGCLAMLVIDSKTREVVDARIMVGATIFARFKARPEFLGPIDGLVEKSSNKRVREALEYAIEQYKATLRSSKARTATLDEISPQTD